MGLFGSLHGVPLASGGRGGVILLGGGGVGLYELLVFLFESSVVLTIGWIAFFRF